MKITPKNMIDRMIRLKCYDEEIYMFIASMNTLLGIALGLCIAKLILVIISYI